MVSSKKEAASAVSSQEEGSANALRRILVVEDNRDSREMVRTLLASSNSSFSVTAVETAAEALVLDERKPFDLYILDIWLPGMDGLGLCRRLRERGRTQPIIFFSAMVQPTDRHYVLAAGADEFLVKPKDIDKFLPTVTHLLGIETNGSAT
ncbi:MAG TPA: response regulator [Pyrinomonadaceae bacterium]|nr:response regulator [Pyrinomonadaceae bacterium]